MCKRHLLTQIFPYQVPRHLPFAFVRKQDTPKSTGSSSFPLLTLPYLGGVQTPYSPTQKMPAALPCPDAVERPPIRQTSNDPAESLFFTASLMSFTAQDQAMLVPTASPDCRLEITRDVGILHIYIYMCINIYIYIYICDIYDVYNVYNIYYL